MNKLIDMPQKAFKYQVEVSSEGHIELDVPMPPGTHVTIFIVEESEELFTDMVSASESSLGFWDNPLDDEDWNNA
ncbi:MAG: hypothetical protein GY805_18640 [Chloroflexi bacterium]|nr:hypothetical protein [Chloroflexota bacterium]